MRVLVIAERDQQTIRTGSLCALGFANDVAQQTGGSVEWLVLGHDVAAAAAEAARYAPVLTADAAALAAVTTPSASSTFEANVA